MPQLGVNIDHVATVREARKAREPDPVWAAVLAELGGADGITVHLREDRRHIQDRDVQLLRETVHARLNLEMACEPGVVEIACQLRPHQATLVPERREELTTEGGLDVVGNLERVREVVERLQAAGIFVSLFVDPDPVQVEAAAESGAEAVELHTGCYARAKGDHRNDELIKLVSAGRRARGLNLTLNAGHGLDYHNVRPVAEIQDMYELNIGHSIVSRAVLVGMERAVREMKALLGDRGSG